MGLGVVAEDTALDLGGLTERGTSWLAGGGKVWIRVLRMSGVAGAVTDRVVGSRSDDEREFGALRKFVLETENAARWPENRFLMDGK